MERRVVVATGKRKTAIARAVVRPGKGIVRINGILLDVYEPWLARLRIKEPLILAGEKAKQVDIEVNVRGGGIMAQADAARTAIARGLVEFFEDPELERIFEKYDKYLLVWDPRRTEPQKPYRSAARRWRQTSKR